MSQENKETVEVEAETVEKKENKFSKWFKDAKKNISDEMLENNIANQYSENHDAYTVYPYNGNLFTKFDIYGDLEGDTLTYFGEKEVPSNCVLINDETKKAFYCLEGKEKAEVKIAYKGIEYTRPATKIKLNPNVEEVKVIKAGDRYFLYKGE